MGCHDIVQNAYVVNDLRNKGVIFIKKLNEVPSGNRVIFSAHGDSKVVITEAAECGLRVFDAIYPLVAKMRREGREMVMIDHAGHPEVDGTMRQTHGGMYLVETVADRLKD